MNNYFGVTFSDGKKEIYLADNIHTYKNEQDAKINSMDFSFTRCESIDGFDWRNFYRGKEIKMVVIRTDKKL